MRRLLVGLCILGASAGAVSAQDTSFSTLTLRLAALTNPVSGRLSDDWKSGTGGQLEAASNVGRGEIGLAVGHVGYDATTGKPRFTGTFFSLAWTTPIARAGGASLDLGARLSDLRMDIDDPSLVGGLRTEEEVMLSGVARGHVALGRRFSAYADVSYGVLMLSTKTPMLLVAAGIERSFATPSWLRSILR